MGTGDSIQCCFCKKFKDDLIQGPDILFCEMCVWDLVDVLRKRRGDDTVAKSLGMDYRTLQNIYTIANIGFNPPLDPVKYLVPVSIADFDKIKKYISSLEDEVSKLRKQNEINSIDFITDI